jgi:hypothetical protein
MSQSSQDLAIRDEDQGSLSNFLTEWDNFLKGTQIRSMPAPERLCPLF